MPLPGVARSDHRSANTQIRQGRISEARASAFPGASTLLRRAKRCNAATGSQPFLQTVLRKEHARSSMCVDDLRRARAMRCMACGEEMRLTRVVRDETCERHTLHCLGCEEVERPLVLLAPRHDAGAKDNQADQKFAPSSAWARAVAALRGRQRSMDKPATGAKTNAQWDREFSQLWDEPFPRQRLS